MLLVLILTKYWILTITEENWETVKREGIYGAPEDIRPPTELIRPGDVLIFYVKKKGSRKLGGKFVGAYEVTSEWYHESKPLWPDEVREGKVKYPLRVKLKLIKLGIADFTELAPKLSFIGNKARPHAYLVGIPANLRRPIPVRDAELILNVMK